MSQIVGGMSARRGMVFVAMGAMCWGGAGASGRMLGEVAGATSLQMAATRALVGGLGLVALSMVTRRVWSLAKAWRRIAAMVVLTVTYQGCFFTAVALGPINVVTLVTVGSAPVFVSLINAVRFRSLRRLEMGIVLVALLGLGLLVQPSGHASADGADWPLVIGLALGAGLSFALMTLLNEKVLPGVDPLASTGVAFVLAGVVLVLVSVPSGASLVWSTQTVFWMAMIGLVSTTAAYALYFTGLPAASAPVGALFALLEPLTATMIALVAFGETLTLFGWGGAVLLIVAVGSTAVIGPAPRRPTAVVVGR